MQINFYLTFTLEDHKLLLLEKGISQNLGNFLAIAWHVIAEHRSPTNWQLSRQF